METRINMSFIYSGIEELREIEEIYNNCFNIEDWGKIEFPSLKYTFCLCNLKDAFMGRLVKLKTDIKNMLEKLNNYKDTEIKAKLEKENLEEIIQNLILIEKEIDEQYHYFRHYLITLAKRYDTFKTEIAKHIYINVSEDIIYSQIKTIIKYEKSFIIVRDNLNRLIKLL